VSDFKIQLKGIERLMDRIQKAPMKIKLEISRELLAGAEVIVRNAIRDAPVDEGGLRRGISLEKKDDLNFKVVSAAEYSPFVEWGTRKKVSVPAELSSYAQTFKGAKGSGSREQAFKAILGWVRRKGIRIDSSKSFKSGKKKGQKKKLTLEQTARIIFHAIMVNGVKPKPYFFKNYFQQAPIIVKNIEAVLNRVI